MNNKNEIAPASIKAGDIMTKHLISLRMNDSIRHAAAVFLDKNISGAPVLDQEDRPVGVITKTDIVRCEREHLTLGQSEKVRGSMRAAETLEVIAQYGFHPETEENRVYEWMTPQIFTLSQEASLADVLREMVHRRIHRLFIREEKTRKLTGVITTFDLMRLFSRLFMVEDLKAGSRKAAAAR